ncbi:MAG: TonB-dependent receptor [Ekhidna sp.]
MFPAKKCVLLLLLAICFAGSNKSFSQSILENSVGIKGNYILTDALDSISKTFPIAYSPDKLPRRNVDISTDVSLGQWLKQLNDQKLLAFKVENGQVVISPYVKKTFTVNGVLKDQDTGENVIGAAVQVAGTTLGTITNGYGYYSITLEEGTYKLKYSHVGYATHETEVVLHQNVYLKVGISPLITTLEEVEVNAIASDINIIDNVPSVNRIAINKTDGQIPYFLGEVDVIQNALLKPGIKAIGEDASGIHVRGGAVDQNLTLLDEATIYNPNHFYGLISVFNPEAVNDVKILKGYIPPSYGGRISSVVEVRQKEGNDKRLSYSGGVGILSARGLVEGPIDKIKGSFLLSGRQSLLNLSLEDFASTSVRRNRIRFQDLNFKINSKPNKFNTFYLSSYYGNDRNAVGLNSIRKWGNRMINFRWNHLFTPKIFANLSSFISEYNYRIENDEEPGAFVGRSKITDIGLKYDVTYSFNPINEITFGFNSILHMLSPGSREPFEPDDDTNIIKLDNERGLESALYIGHDLSIGDVSLNYGMRLSMLHNFGPGKVFLYENGQPTSDTAIVDTLNWNSGELINWFRTFEPRIALNWRWDENTALKASYSKTAQYIHLISNTISPSPTDIWKLTNDYIPPLISNQYTLGIYKNLRDDQWEASVEGYYKAIPNNIQYKNGADLVFNQNIETELLLSKARAYGIEFYLKKQKGALKGWVSYTLSRAESKLNINENERYIPVNHDKTHDFSTSWSMDISERLSASANFLYNTGIPVTLPTDKYVFENNLVPHFGLQNNERLPDYHRLDLSLKLSGKKFKKSGKARKNRDYWILTIYNVYARKNAFSYFFRESQTNPGLGEIVQYSIFGTILPAITYNFKF